MNFEGPMEISPEPLLEKPAEVFEVDIENLPIFIDTSACLSENENSKLL